MKLAMKIKNVFSRNQRVTESDFPKSIILEPTNACNLRCRMCSVWGEGVKKSRDVGFIKRDAWTAILDEIGSWPAKVDLDIHGAGEPLLHPDFLDMLAYAKSKKNIHLGFLCNATLLDAKKAEAAAGLVDWVGFSVDGAQKDIFEHYRKGAVLAEVEDNIERVISLKRDGKPGIFLNMVAHSEADTALFIERWKGKADTLQISLKRPVNRENNRKITLIKPCTLPFQQFIIGWSGHAVLCCEDCWGEYIIGKFPEDSLYNIWHGKKMNKARLLLKKGRQEEIPLCRCCDSGIFHDYRETSIENTHVRIELPSIKPEYGRVKA
jgi:sulfatase maturation enzyme AslB (radical SAM superfamily)